MTCPQCAAQLSAGAKFCSECGAALVRGETARERTAPAELSERLRLAFSIRERAHQALGRLEQVRGEQDLSEEEYGATRQHYEELARAAQRETDSLRASAQAQLERPLTQRAEARALEAILAAQSAEELGGVREDVPLELDALGGPAASARPRRAHELQLVLTAALAFCLVIIILLGAFLLLFRPWRSTAAVQVSTVRQPSQAAPSSPAEPAPPAFSPSYSAQVRQHMERGNSLLQAAAAALKDPEQARQFLASARQEFTQALELDPGNVQAERSLRNAEVALVGLSLP